jgi:hypothetical protein
MAVMTNNNDEPKKPRQTKKDVDQAFDALAQFLFEQYRKQKREGGTEG